MVSGTRVVVFVAVGTARAVIHLDDRGPVALLPIDRPERRNALDHEALDQLLDALDRSRSARVVVITGAGGHFCAGADLSRVEEPPHTPFGTASCLDSVCTVV